MSPAAFSIVCVYNSPGILEDWLLRGLKDQTAAYELIKVDNTSGAFASAAAALNYGGRKAKGDYIIFMHQDVRLLSPDWLERAAAILGEIKDLGVAGVAGMLKTAPPGFFSVSLTPPENRLWAVCHGLEMEPSICRKDFTAPAEVQTLDEQLLAVPRPVFERLQFDERTCAGWHLYGVDYALSARRAGLKVYALPLQVCHRSGGAVNDEYYSALVKVLEKHRAEKMIYTTCGLWRTSGILNTVSLLGLAVRSEAGRWLGRNDHGAAPFIERLKALLGAKSRAV